MAEISERHEIRVRGKSETIVFTTESDDGRLVIRQEHDGKKPKEACSITLADPDELRAFFQGLRRILASLGYDVPAPEAQPTPTSPSRTDSERSDGDREAVIAKARQRSPQAFAPWTHEEEEEVRRRHAAGESLQSIARAHKRSPRAIELRLQRLGVLPATDHA